MARCLYHVVDVYRWQPWINCWWYQNGYLFCLTGRAWSVARGHGELVAFGRKIDYANVARAGSVAFLSVMLVGGMVTLLGLSIMTSPSTAWRSKPYLPLAQ